MRLGRDLADQAEHRRVHAVGGEQRRAGVEQAGAGHHGIGLRLAGRERRAERHVGRALLVAGVDDRKPVGGALEGVEQVVVVHAGQRVDGARGRARAGSRRWPRRSSCRRSDCFLSWIFGLSACCTPARREAANVQSAAPACRAACLDKADPPCAFRAPPPILGIGTGTRQRDPYASLPLPHLRRASRRRHRPGRAAVRLGPPHPRPRRRAVHRPARPLRPDPGRRRPGLPGVQARRDAARGVGRAHRRQGARKRPAGTENPDLPTGAGRGLYRRDRGARSGRRTADAGVRRPGLSGGDPAQVPLPRPAPRQAAPEHHAARAGDRLDPPPHEGAAASSNSRRRS